MSRIPGKSIWSKLKNKRTILLCSIIWSQKTHVIGIQRSWNAWCREEEEVWKRAAAMFDSSSARSSLEFSSISQARETAKYYTYSDIDIGEFWIGRLACCTAHVRLEYIYSYRFSCDRQAGSGIINKGSLLLPLRQSILSNK